MADGRKPRGPQPGRARRAGEAGPPRAGGKDRPAAPGSADRAAAKPGAGKPRAGDRQPAPSGPPSGGKAAGGKAAGGKAAGGKAAGPGAGRHGGARPQAGPARRRPGMLEDALLIYGQHAAEAALLNPRRRCRRVLAAEDAQAGLDAVLARAKAQGLVRPTPERVDRRELDRLTDGAVHQGVALVADPLAPPRLEELIGRLGEEPATLVVLDRVTDPHNVGAILRSAAVFGARGVIVTDRHAPAETGALARAASGALELVPLLRVVNLARTLAWLKANGFACLGLDEAGTPPAALPVRSERLALVLGAEGEGLRRLTREGCDALLRLPAAGPMSTLNVSCAASVALYAAAAARESRQGGA